MNPTIHGKSISASAILEALGNDLLRIKMEDNLRWSDIGVVLGKSEDQAAKYADASASMDVVAFTRGRLAWNGRFTGSLDKMVERATDHIDGHQMMTLLFAAGGELARAMEDGAITDAEILQARRALEDLRAGIDKLLCRVGPKVAVA